jgi:hypothetical protein
MKSRNELVKLKYENGGDFRPQVKGDPSTEQKLISQYLFNSAGLPLHIRRTLDQFGYPNLEDTTERDSDQVVFKWAKDANDKLKDKLEKQAKAKHSVGLPCDTQFQTLPSIGVNMVRDEDRLKVLMVDQLWCWIINKGELSLVVLFPVISRGHFFCRGFDTFRENCLVVECINLIVSVKFWSYENLLRCLEWLHMSSRRQSLNLESRIG